MLLKPYADEPLVDEEWVRVHSKEQEKRQSEEELENRVGVGYW